MRKILVFPIMLVLLAGCASEAVNTSPQKEGTHKSDLKVEDYERDTSVKAEINPETGKIILPLEKYFMDEDEQSKTDEAILLSMARCMKAEGATVFWVHTGQQTRNENKRYGRWSLDNATQYGYADVKNKAGDRIRNFEMAFVTKYSEELNSPIYTESLDKCGSNKEDEEIIAHNFEATAPQEVLDMREISYDLMQETPEAQKVKQAWKKCMENGGYTVSEEGGAYTIDGVSHIDVNETSIQAAVADVKCKEQTNLIQTLADIEASFQSVVEKEYKTELVEMKKSVQKSLEEAENYIIKHKKEALEIEKESTEIN